MTDKRNAMEGEWNPAKVFSERNLKKKRGAFWTCFIAAALLVLLAAAGAVYLNAVKVERFENALLENVDYASLGTDELSVRSFARETIFYLTGAQEMWNPQITIAGFPASSFIPQSFRDHMAEVRGWVSSASAVFLTGAAIVLLLLGRALTRRRAGGKSGFSVGGYYLGAGLALAALAGVGLWAYFDFNEMWMALHKLLIPDGIFGADELVMRLFPESLFAAYLPPIVRLFGILMAVVALLPLILAPVGALIAGARGAGRSRATTSARGAGKPAARRAGKKSNSASR